MGNGILWLALAVAFVFAVIILPQWRVRRAVRQVIKVFQTYGATSPASAVTLEQLGLQPQGGLLRFLMGRRDYKKYAIEAMLKAALIQPLEDGRLYLVEDKLARLRL
ncbi:MAG: hypothetical protein V1780_06170 [Chloroflexota bacterium]